MKWNWYWLCIMNYDRDVKEEQVGSDCLECDLSILHLTTNCTQYCSIMLLSEPTTVYYSCSCVSMIHTNMMQHYTLHVHNLTWLLLCL